VVVWGAIEINDATDAPCYRAGINFRDADVNVLERLLAERNEPLSAAPDDADASQAGGSSIVRGTARGARPRAERRRRTDVPWLSTVKLPWGTDARLLNISTTGVLLEAGVKVTPGTVTELKLCGPEWEIAVAAHFVRSEVADVDGVGVKYHLAAMFDTRLEFPATD
jgi:hypothetical protein